MADDGSAPPTINIDLGPIKHLIEQLRARIDDVFDYLARVRDRIGEEVKAVLETIVPRIADAIAAALGSFGALVMGLLDNLVTPDQLALLIGQELAKNVPKISAWWGTVSEGAVTPVLNQAALWSAATEPGEWVKRVDDYIRSRHGAEPPDELAKSFRNMPGIAQVFLGVALTTLSLYSYAQAATAGDTERWRAASLSSIRPIGLDVPAVMEAERRGIIDRGAADRYLSFLGVSEEAHGDLTRLAEHPFDLDRITQAWVRGLITTADRNKMYNALGVPPERHDMLEGLALAVAGPMDVVSLAGREAFEEEQVRILDLDAEYDTVDWSWADKAGLREPWRKFYWRAHWQPVATGQALEMFQRAIITDEQLDTIFKAQEYTPVWRDKLKQLSYNVLTRVDTRRMHDLGVMTREQVKRAYQDQGYTPENAELMTQFSERLVADHKQDELERRAGPVRRELLDGYRSGLLSRHTARQSIVSLGFTEVDTDTALLAIEVDRQRVADDSIRDAIGRLYTTVLISSDDARERLTRLGMDGAAIGWQMAQWDAAREVREMTDAERSQRDLTKAEVLAGYRERLTTLQAATEALARLGYDVNESAALLALEDSRVERQRIAEREAVTRAQLLAGRILPDTARTALTAGGTPPERVALLVERWQVERDERTPDVPLSSLEELAREGLISDGDLREELERRGYTAKEAEWLASLWGLHEMVAERRLELQERAIVSREKLAAARLEAERSREEQRSATALTLADIREQAALQRANLARAGALEVVGRQIESRERLAAAQATTQASLLERRLASQGELQAQRLASTAALQEQRVALTRERDEAQNALQRQRLDTQLAAIDRKIEAAERLQAARVSAQERLQEQRAGLAEQAAERANVRRIAAEQRQEARAIGGETRKYVRELETRGIGLAEKQAEAAARAQALTTVQEQLRALLGRQVSELEARIRALGIG